MQNQVYGLTHGSGFGMPWIMKRPGHVDCPEIGSYLRIPYSDDVCTS